MMRNSLIVAFAFVLLPAASTALAQGSTTQPKPQASPAGSPTANVPVGKVAVIFSAAFQDAKVGIARFTVLLSKLNGEFQKTQDDLNQTAARIKQLEDEVSKAQTSAAAVDPKTVQAKIDQLDQLKKDYQRKGEDAQAQYQKRREEIFAPLQEDVSKYLDAYAKAHGIALIIDGSQVQGILFVGAGVDITNAFISEYNLKNPATASTTK